MACLAIAFKYLYACVYTRRKFTHILVYECNKFLCESNNFANINLNVCIWNAKKYIQSLLCNIVIVLGWILKLKAKSIISSNIWRWCCVLCVFGYVSNCLHLLIIAFDFTLVEQLVFMFIYSFINYGYLLVYICTFYWEFYGNCMVSITLPL